MANIGLESIYPIGSIYMSFNKTNPSHLFKFGEWEPIIDKFLFCSNLNRKAKEIGGESRHKLTIDEMPAHKHSNDSNNILTYRSDEYYYNSLNDEIDINHHVSIKSYGEFNDTDNRIIYKETETTGESKEFDIMPPYITCYAWTRIK